MCSGLNVRTIFIGSFLPTLLVGCAAFSSASTQVSDSCDVLIPNVADPSFQFELVIDDLASPVHITHANDGSDRLFVVLQDGQIRILQGALLFPAPFLDIRDRVNSAGGEQGLLSMAFHPNHSDNGRFFVNYTRREDGATVISEFRVGADPDVAQQDSERVILTIGQPFSNHNGGQIQFGPDGFLYIGMGDGGAGGDPQGNGQDLATLHGSLLRIDIDNNDGNAYDVPEDNPFLDNPDARQETWAFGFRNPWRFSFDRCGGRLFLGDVGQNSWEEINLVEGGRNYGWNTMEGSRCFRGEFCVRGGLELPIAEYSRSGGECSVTGGYVYRGTAVPDLIGHYLFADFCTGQFWTLFQSSTEEWVLRRQQRTGFNVSSFGEDEVGELYVVDLGGAVYRVIN